MAWVKAAPSEQTKPAAVATGTAEKPSNKTQTMKTLTKIALALLATAVTSRAERVNRYFRSNGTFVSSYYRTPPSCTPSYRYSSSFGSRCSPFAAGQC